MTKINAPVLSVLRILEIADFATDVLSARLIYKQVDSVFQVMIAFSLLSTFCVNVFGYYWEVRSRTMRSFHREKVSLGLGFLLVAFEDLIMILFNYLFLLKSNLGNDNEDLGSTFETAIRNEIDFRASFDVASVMISIVLGFLLIMIRFWGDHEIYLLC